MTKETHKGQDGTLAFSPQAVQLFLESHPDFFDKYPDILKNLNVPHGHIGTVSLIEKQVKVLQEENRQLKQEIATWVNHAKENEALLIAIKTLTLKLMKADTLEDFVEVLESSLLQDFSIDFVGLKLNQGIEESCPQSLESRLIKQEGLSLGMSGTVSTGSMDSEDLKTLFGIDADAITSTAQIPLNGLGILVLGSQRASQFREDDGTLFLGFIQDMINAILPIFIELPH